MTQAMYSFPFTVALSADELVRDTNAHVSS
jgi:hypothetical protein